MPRPKQSITGNLVALGVFLLPAAVAVLVYKATGSAAAGWLTLATFTGLLLVGVATFVATINISHARPNLTKTQLAWLAILVFTAALILMAVPLILIDR